MPTVTRQIQVRQGTAAQWAATNPVLLLGEPGYDTDGKILKLGDGVTPWSSLSGVRVGASTPYVNPLNTLTGLNSTGSGLAPQTSGGILSTTTFTSGLVSGIVDTSKIFTGPDQWAEVKVGNCTSGWIGVGVRCTPMSNGYTQGVFVTWDASNTYRLWVRSPSANTNSGNPSGFQIQSVNGTIATSDVIRIELRGSTATALRNGNPILSSSDGQIATATGVYPSIPIYDTGVRADELRAGELPGFV